MNIILCALDMSATCFKRGIFKLQVSRANNCVARHDVFICVFCFRGPGFLPATGREAEDCSA